MNDRYDPMMSIPKITERRLDYMGVYAQVSASEDMVAGMHHAEMRDYVDMYTRHLVLELKGHVLTEATEGPVSKSSTHTFRFTYPVKPKWMPKALWRRIPWAVAEVPHTTTLSVQPKWKYPHATTVHPLGQPVRMLEAPSVRSRTEWRQS